MAAIISPNPSPQLQTVLTWVDGLNRWDLDQMLSVASDNYTHYIFPESLGIESRSKQEWREYFTTVLPMFQDFTMTILDIVESLDKVVFHASATAISTTGFPFANEYIMVLHLIPQPNGLPKISVFKEFVDSKLSLEFFVGERKRQAEKQQA